MQTPTPERPLANRFSALLRDLARVPEVEVGTGWGALQPGAIVGRFELVREVGRGGFGVVYEALDRNLGRTVAFKAVQPGDRLDIREERLLREAEAAARLSHPNIVTLYDVGRSEPGPYLVLEFLRGHTLARRIEHGPLSVLEALRIGVEVAKGVAHAHASGVVHRDLTPGNVFLCDDGRVKVLDLGMAHAFGRLRVDGGTPGYMAPEQQRGAPEDERTDVFALGVILYRMLTNDLPFPDRSARPAVMATGLQVPAVPALGKLIARMLEHDPVKRPRDAGAVLAELTGFLQELERTPSSGDLPPPRKMRRLPVRAALFITAAVVLAVAAGVGAKWVDSRKSDATAAAPAASIAVLPFVDLSPEQDQEYFSDGLADEILNALARLEGLRVPGRTSSFFFKGKTAKVADIGRELNVRAVLEGSVRKAGNRVRVNAQIVNVADGYRLWAQTYDRELTDIFAVQDDIARAVVDALNVKLLGRAAPSMKSYATENPEAYTQYLLGRQQYNRVTRESLRLAIEAYERALALDPGYAPAWAGLGIPLYYMADQEKTPDAVMAQRRRALAAAERAVALAPDLPDALSTRGLLRGILENDWAGAKADLERALAVNPNDADGHRRYAGLLADLGRLPQAIAQLRKSVDLDPLGHSWVTLGSFSQATGELDVAEAAFRRHLQIAPATLPGLLGLGRNLLLQSKPKEALALFESLPEEDFALWGKAAAEHALVHPAASQAALDALISKYAHTRTLSIAEVYAWRGEKDRAFEWLARASAEPGGLGGAFRVDPFLSNVRDDPRFVELLRKMKLPVD